MAVSSSTILAAIYGEHAIAGVVLQWKTVATVTTALVLLGDREMSGIVAAYYNGELIDPSKYTFHPGRLSIGADDPVQGVDTRLGATGLTDGQTYSGTAYVTIELPADVSNNAEPDKFVFIVKGLLVPNFDSSGNYYPPDPSGLTLTSQSTGSLPAGTYYIVVATVDDGDVSVPSSEGSITIDGVTKKQITVEWSALSTDLTKRIYFSTATGQQKAYFETNDATTFVLDHTAGATVDTVPTTQGGYSTNMARIWADQIINIRKLPATRINWAAWTAVRDDSDHLISWDDGETILTTPTGVALTAAAAGLLAAATYYIKVAALAGGCETAASIEHSVAVTLHQRITANWDVVPNTYAYRIYIGTAAGAENVYVDVKASPTAPGPPPNTFDIVSLPVTAGTPLGATTGTGKAIKRWECNLAFPSPTDVIDALYATMQQAGAFMQDASARLTLISAPRSDNTLTPAATLDLDNQVDSTFVATRKLTRALPNQMPVAFRDTDDQFLQPVPGFYIKREKAIARVGHTITTNLTTGNMNQSQARRLGEGEMRKLADLPITLKLGADCENFAAIAGDTILETHDVPGYTGRKFLIVESRDLPPGDKPDEREFTVMQYPADDALYKDSDHQPRQSITYVGGNS
jgi:hypothetical protein